MKHVQMPNALAEQALASASPDYICNARWTQSTGPLQTARVLLDTSRSRHICGSLQLDLQRDGVHSSSLDVYLHGMSKLM